MKNTEEMFRQQHHEFGPLHHFRNGQCVSSFCNQTFQQFGVLAKVKNPINPIEETATLLSRILHGIRCLGHAQIFQMSRRPRRVNGTLRAVNALSRREA
eukprot:g22218.t1